MAQALADDKLYRDCIELNVQPGSLLVARYMEDEEAFDAVADNCTKNCTKKIISHARKYTVKKEKQLLSKYDINELIYEVRGRVKAEFIRNIKYHLLNDRLETINNYDNGGYWDDAWTRSVPVDPENYDDFAEYFADKNPNSLYGGYGVDQIENMLERFYPIKLFSELYDEKAGFYMFREFNPAGARIIEDWFMGEDFKVLELKYTNDTFGTGDLMSLIYRVASYLQSLAQIKLGEISEVASLNRSVLLRDPLDKNII